MITEFTFLVLGVILFIGFFGELIYGKTDIPDVVWLILIGIALSSIFHIVSPDWFVHAAPLFTTFALIFLLFEAGLNTDIRRFYHNVPQGLLLSIVSFILSFLVVFFLGLLITQNGVLSLLLASILGGISSAVILPIIKRLKISSEAKLSLLFDSAFSDVFCILITVTIVEVITLQVFNPGDIIGKLLASFLIAIALGATAGYIWIRWSMQFFLKKGNFYLMTLAFMIMLFSITQIVNANGAIACLIFGLMLGNTNKGIIPEKIDLFTAMGKEFYSELAFFLKTFFFVYLGILIDFSNPLSFLWAFFIAIALFLVRPFAVFLAFKRSSLIDIKTTEVLIPRGLAAAVLVQLPLQAEIPGAANLVNITLAVVFFTIIISAAFTYLVQHGRYHGLYKFLYRKSESIN